MVVAASIRNQRSDDGFALLKRDNTARTCIGVAIDESALAGREVISRQRQTGYPSLHCRASPDTQLES